MAQVVVEVVLLASAVPVDVAGPSRGEGVAYAVRRRVASDDETPDAVARELAPAEVEVVHSTSWRHDGPGVVVLTYVAAPAPAVEGMLPLLDPAVVCSGDPLLPSPPGLHAHHVAAHGVRHLAYLAVRDPGIVAAVRSSRDPGFWSALAGLGELPTGTHEAVHKAAHLRAAADADDTDQASARAH